MLLAIAGLMLALAGFLTGRYWLGIVGSLILLSAVLEAHSHGR